MGYMVKDSAILFEDVKYNTKTTAELREAMLKKLDKLQLLIKQRESRLVNIRKEYEIDAEQLAILVMRFQESGDFVSYDKQGNDTNAPLIPAGVIANIVKERKMIDSEQKQTSRLEMILRNLRDEEYYHHPRTGEVLTRPALHELDDRDLEYLGF